MSNTQKKDGLLGKVLLISISIMFVISSTSLLHSNEAEFIIDRFEGITSFSFSLFDTILYVAYLIAGPFVGFLSARTGRRRIFVIIGAAGTAFATICMTLVHNYSLLLVFRFFEGAFCVASWQTLMTMILDLSDSTNRGRNMGIFGTFMAISMGLGPMFGGFLAKISLFTPYYVSSAQCVLAFIITVLFIREPLVAKASQKPGIAESLAFARTKPAVIVPAMFNLVDRLHMSFIIFMVPLMLKQLLKLGPEYRGMLLGVNGLSYIILQYPIGRLSDRVGRFKL
ncbi:MAG: MFS transporter, partial [Spirochaetales bacterium]|nr:MFS transporter [Spirochaetales bacterium]